MKKHQILRLFISIFMLTFAVNMSAQSNGDKLFMEGQKWQQTQTVAAQNQAIKKFQSAKIVYTTAEKKKMCDNQIAICNTNIASLKKGTKKNTTVKTKETQETVAPSVNFSLSQSRVEFDGEKAGAFNVSITAPTINWAFNIPSGVDGMETFATVTRSSDAKSIDIKTDANPFTLERSQTVNVTYENRTEILTITQKGKPVTLSTSKNLLEYGLKGGNKTIEVYTNSDSIISSNNGLTWYVESKPDWVETNVEVKKEKGLLGAAYSAGKNLIGGKVTAATAADVKTSNLRITVKPLIKSDSEYLTGRRGEIIFASQDKKYTITVVQQK